MYICEECNEIFNEEDLIIEKEMVGYYGSQPTYQSYMYSPCCKADVHEISKNENEESE